MAAKFVVAFGPNMSYVFSNRKNTIWMNIPQQLADLLQTDARFQPHKLQNVALGPNSAYFIQSTEGTAWHNIHSGLQSKVNELGGWTSVTMLLFGSDPDAYLVCDTKGQCFGENLSQEFYDATLRFAFYGFKDLCFTPNGGHALTANNNMLSYKNVSEAFIDTWKRGSVKQAITSAFDEFFFIEFGDGSSAYSCPPAWHGEIDQLRNAVPIVSSSSATDAAAASANVLMAQTRLFNQLETARHRSAMRIIDSIEGRDYT